MAGGRKGGVKGRFDWLRKAISPEGPIGEWLSPSEVYKTRSRIAHRRIAEPTG